VVGDIAPELNVVTCARKGIFGAETIVPDRQREDHLPVRVARAVVAGVGVAAKDIDRQVGVGRAGLALHGHREWDRHRDRGALVARDGAMVRIPAPELRAVAIGGLMHLRSTPTRVEKTRITHGAAEVDLQPRQRL